MNDKASAALWVVEEPPTPKCKHGLTDCPRCPKKRDKHVTRNGKGAVARIRRTR